MKKQNYIGSSLDDLLEDDGTLEEIEAVAMKRIIVWKLVQAMEKTDTNKTQLAEKMSTSRTVVNRLLDEEDTSLTLTTLTKASHALGMTWRLESVEQANSPKAA